MHVMPEKIIIADDHPLFRQALLIALKEQFKTTHWLEAETVESVSECLCNGQLKSDTCLSYFS
nr:hypothetical protein [Moritella viscosa]SHO03094.1 DNA-binding response regulator, LuxR family [Moritella viscosa]